MFTGIISGTTQIKSVRSIPNGKELTVHFADASRHLALGDSIALDGVCTTAIRILDTEFVVQLLKETLQKTSLGKIAAGSIVNWELAATPSTALGGHIVYGHVDETGTVRHITQSNDFAELAINYSSDYQKYLIPKGSICINGISLTVGDVHPDFFTCYLIPHTLNSTSLRVKNPSDLINLEYDIIAKYLYNFSTGSTSKSLKTTLNKAGYL